MRREWGLILGVLFLLSAGARSEVPWAGKETLVYEVHWGMVVAAEVKFQVAGGPRGWDAVLDLRSRGMVDTLYPIRSRFVSQFDPEARHSFGLESIRKEGGDDKHHRVTLDPEQRKGRYENVLEKSQVSFHLSKEACQDVVSIFYAARTVVWTPGVFREWDVCEKQKIKRVRLECEKEETITNAAGEETACMVLGAEELPDRKGKLSKKPWRVKIWVEKASSKPLRADLRAAFGTFRLTRVAPEP